MDLNLVPFFLAIYRERSLTRSAEILGVSQPYVSSALRRLRAEYQDSLFIRKAHGVEPTVRAHAIAEKLEQAMSLMREAAAPEGGFDPAREERTFTLGMSDYCMAVIMPALYAELRRSAPGISIAIRHPGNEGARKALESDTFHLLLGNVQTPLGRTRQQQLFTEGFTALVDVKHPLANRNFGVDELNEYPALLTEGAGNEQWWEHPKIKMTGYAPKQVFSIPVFLGVSLLLRDSPLVCISSHRLSRMFKKAHPVTEVPLPFGEHRIAIRQFWHERWHADPAHRWLRHLIYTVCQDIEAAGPVMESWERSY